MRLVRELPIVTGSLFAIAISLIIGATTTFGEPLAPKGTLIVEPKLSVDDDEATNVSGAACYVINGVRRSCLLIGDEVKYARLFAIERSRLIPNDRVFLLP